MTDRKEQVFSILQTTFTPSALEVIDRSAEHKHHAGVKDGRGHFEVHIVSANFDSLSLLERHKAIYAALADMMLSDIHALSIRAHSPQEAATTLTCPHAVAAK